MTTTMANPMTEHPSAHPSPAQVRRGRRTALLLFAVGFGPMVLATLMYYTGWLNPTGQTNHGNLIQPVVTISALNLVDANGKPLVDRFRAPVAPRQWLLIVAAEQCDEGCESMLYLARQVNIALGKDANRVGRAAYLAQLPADLEARWSEEYGGMELLQPGNQPPTWPVGANPAQGAEILLVDPLGNVMMQYTPANEGEDILKDLKRLLKLSQLG